MRKVRCVKIDDYQESLLVGKIYDVLEESKYNFKICDEDGFTCWYLKEGFEEVKDTILDSVIEQYNNRSAEGLKKYGTTMDRNDLKLSEWLQHLQEELMDATLYIEKLKQTL